MRIKKKTVLKRLVSYGKWLEQNNEEMRQIEEKLKPHCTLGELNFFKTYIRYEGQEKEAEELYST